MCELTSPTVPMQDRVRLIARENWLPKLKTRNRAPIMCDPFVLPKIYIVYPNVMHACHLCYGSKSESSNHDILTPWREIMHIFMYFRIQSIFTFILKLQPRFSMLSCPNHHSRSLELFQIYCKRHI